MTRFTLTLRPREFVLLQDLARRERRTVRDQAAYLIVQALRALAAERAEEGEAA